MKTLETFEPTPVSIVLKVYLCSEMTEQRFNILKRAEALFMKFGIRSVTMDDIARELGISKKTLYQAYENKQALIEAVMELFQIEMREADEQFRLRSNNAVEMMYQVSVHIAGLFRKMPASAMFDLQKYHRDIWDKFDAVNSEYIQTVCVQNLQWGFQDGLYRRDLYIDVVTRLYVGLSRVISDERLFGNVATDPAAVFLHMLDYHMHAICTPKGLDLWQKLKVG